MQVGDILSNKYQLIASIGRGGMGEVFHAVHLASGSNVAIKVVNRVLIAETMMARFEREAAAVARIQSEFIPQMLDVDRTAAGELFLVMELLHGETLSERLKKGAPGYMAWDEVFALGRDVLCALMDAHAAGVVHRDLKPGNIFLEHLADGTIRARILDFGVCKFDQDAERLTTTGEAVGTIAYMAPEQIRGASHVDERADLYSFAMVIFEALTGRLAYDASGQMALLASKLERSARSLNTVVRVPVPGELDALVARCLARKPEDRPASAEELARAWHALGPPTQPPAELPALLSEGFTRSGPSELRSTLGMATSSPTKGARSLLFVAGGTVLVGTALIAAGLMARSARAAREATDTEIVNALEREFNAQQGVGVTSVSNAESGVGSSSLAESPPPTRIGPVVVRTPTVQDPASIAVMGASSSSMDDAMSRASAPEAGRVEAHGPVRAATASKSNTPRVRPSPPPPATKRPAVEPVARPAVQGTARPAAPALMETPKY